MDTPMILMAADQSAEGTKREQIKPRGRKSSRVSNQKKQPQRGLGVPQLERLRLQEQWKKMTEMPQHLLLPGQIQHQAPLRFADPLTGVPVQCCPGNYDGREGIVSNGGLGFGNGGFSFGSCMIGGLAMADQFQYGFEDQNQKELSSIPKMQCISDHCDFCFKKKLFNGGNVGLNEEKDKNNNEMSNINGSDFLGLNIENIPKLHGQPSCLTANLNKGAEIKQIHRKGNSINGSFLMEYEFFPGKRGSYFKEMNHFQTEDSPIGVNDGEASCIISTSSSHGDPPSTTTPVDLSLKLSF